MKDSERGAGPRPNLSGSAPTSGAEAAPSSSAVGALVSVAPGSQVLPQATLPSTAADTQVTRALPAPTPSRPWPFQPFPSMIVLAVGLLFAMALGIVGLHQLDRSSDALASQRAELLARTLAKRLPELPSPVRHELLRRAAVEAPGTEYVVSDSGYALLDAVLLGGRAPAELARDLARGRGETTTALGRTRFYVARIDHEERARYLAVFVRAPSPPESRASLLGALFALTALLLAVAAVATHLVVGDSARDVASMTERIREMARVTTEPVGDPLPARTTDEVGLLTLAFNDLRSRFEEAQRGYGTDLDRAREQDRDRAAFLAAVSHELRTPLNAILGFADVLLAEVDGKLTSDARENVEQIRGSGAHLSELIQGILEFSALEGGQMRLSLSAVDLEALSRDVLRGFEVLSHGRPIRLYVADVVGGPVLARADTTRVRQILSNLLSNALKFTRRGEIRVKVWKEGKFAVLSVRDTGSGIRPEERAQIFDDYKQSRSEKGRGSGTGLGLAITRRLVVLHGGSIKLASEVGRGSEFRVFLPLFDASEVSASRPDNPAERPRGTR